MGIHKKKKKRFQAVTLIEIMIVIFLIGLIGGVLAFNMRGTLDEGKVFKTEQGISQIQNILMLSVAQGRSLEETARDWQEVVKRSSLVGKPENLLKDGWGKEYRVIIDRDAESLVITSEALEHYREKKQFKGSF